MTAVAAQSSAAISGPRLSIDIGGTFTDLVLARADGRSFSRKVSSTPAAPEDAVMTGLALILADAQMPASALLEVRHGTTVGSNTLLQKVGARTGLITTRGFRDVLEIGRLRTPGMFDLTWDKPEPLIARRHRLEADERIAASGEVLQPLAIDDVLAAGRFFRTEGIESVAMCFLNSYRNPAHERQAAELFAEAFPEIFVTASVDVLPEAGEYERTSTAAVNAYVLPALRGYLGRLEQQLRQAGVNAPLLIGNSNGGLSAVEVAQAKPVFFISSGRASGAVGGARLGHAMNERDLIVFDMGGTTASAALVRDGELERTNEYEFRAGMSVPSRFIKAGGYMMRVPTVDVAEVGSGAGSIAAIDAGGLLVVGPNSAGARPGPACYGLGGTQPTVTDANAVLGLLPPVLAGGAVALDLEAARAAITRSLGAPLGLDVEQAALGIRKVANANMVRAIRAVTIERGLDPRELTLLAFGGSGPAHACDLARMLEIERVLFPLGPGVFTATGMLAGAAEHHELRPIGAPLATLVRNEVEALRDEMQVAARRALAEQGFATDAVTFDCRIDLRLNGQQAALSVPLGDDPGALRAAFLTVYHDTYGYTPADEIEAVSLRLRAYGADGAALNTLTSRDGTGGAKPAIMRRAFFESCGWCDVPIVRRTDFVSRIAGPVIIESDDSTIVIPPEVSAAPSVGGAILATLATGAQP